MGWKDEEIDNLAKNASMHQKVEYNDTYWKEMEALLDAKKPIKKRFGWWFFGALFFLTSIGISFYYYTSKSVEQREILSRGITDLHKNEQTNIAVVEDDNNISSTPSYNKKSINHGELTSFMIEKQTTQEQKVSSLSFSKKSDLKDMDIAISNSTKYSEKKEKEETVEENEIKAKMELTALASEKNFDDDLETIKNIEEEAQISEEDDETDQIISSENSIATTMVEEPILQKKIGFYVGAGAGVATSYIKSSNELLTQWKVNIGIDHTIRNRVRLGGGIGFRQQLVTNLILEQNREYYSLGLIDVNQAIQYDRLQFVDLNIHAHYLFRKIAVGLEVTPSYLVSVRANLNQTKIEYDSSFPNEITTKLEKQFVKSDNFNPFGMDAGITFQYQFKYKMSLEAEINTRLNKMLTNNGFRGEHNRFPVRFELGLIKRF